MSASSGRCKLVDELCDWRVLFAHVFCEVEDRRLERLIRFGPSAVESGGISLALAHIVSQMTVALYPSGVYLREKEIECRNMATNEH